MKSGSVLASKLRCVIYRPFSFQKMQCGAERRLAIIDHILQNGSLPVNRMYCLQINQDPDLQTLLKKGVVKRIRTKSWGKGTNCHYTFLVLV